MHWLLLLAVIASTSNLKGGSSSTLSRLAENELRKQIGTAQTVRVQAAPGRSGARGDFDYFNITLDGFAADRLMNLANQAEKSNKGEYSNRNNRYPNSRLKAEDVLGDILGNGGARGDLGDILGGVLNGGNRNGRIGRIRLKASNFTFNGARYSNLDATFGEIRFDWLSALSGDVKIKSVQPGTLGLSLQADQLARILGPQLPSVRNVRVRFSNGLAYVGGRADYMSLGVPFEVGGRLSVRENEVWVNDIRASVAKLRLPSFVMNELTRGVNPLYDFDKNNRWPLAVNLNTAGAQNNVLSLRGGISWRGFNRQNSRDNDDYRDDYGYDDGDSTYPDDMSTRYPNSRYPDDDYPGDTRSRDDVWGEVFGR
jgi:hypothetical protein